MKKKLIYVLDDSRIICDLIGKVLGQLDECNIVTFTNGKKMLQECGKISPDLIIADVRLDTEEYPFNNGLEILKTASFLSDSKGIVVTGSRDREIIEEIRYATNFDLVHKDDDNFFSLLESKVHEMLDN